MRFPICIADKVVLEMSFCYMRPMIPFERALSDFPKLLNMHVCKSHLCSLT